MNEVFQLREESHYNLRYTSQFTIPLIRSVYNGKESTSNISTKMWKLVSPTTQKLKFSSEDFFSKCDQIRRKLRIWFTFTEEILNGKLYFLRSNLLSCGFFLYIYVVFTDFR